MKGKVNALLLVRYFEGSCMDCYGGIDIEYCYSEP